MPYPTINLLWFTRKEAHKSPKMHDSLFQGDVLLLMQCNDFKMTMKSRTTAEIFSVYSFFSLLVEKKKKKNQAWFASGGFHWANTCEVTNQHASALHHKEMHIFVTSQCPQGQGEPPTAGCRLTHRYVLWIAPPVREMVFGNNCSTADIQSEMTVFNLRSCR